MFKWFWTIFSLGAPVLYMQFLIWWRSLVKIVPEPRAQEYLKYLAVLVDKNLTWKYHFDAIAAK